MKKEKKIRIKGERVKRKSKKVRVCIRDKNKHQLISY
jgi:hypothetical protein